MQHIVQGTIPHMNIQTPTKKAKSSELIEPTTADSDDFSNASIESIDAKQLFEQFDQMIRISQDQEEAEIDETDSSEIYRKLDYQGKTRMEKLNFEGIGSSMKKRTKVMTVECPQSIPTKKSISLFRVLTSEGEDQSLISLSASETRTPKKLISISEEWAKELHQAAKKEQPFRDL